MYTWKALESECTSVYVCSLHERFCRIWRYTYTAHCEALHVAELQLLDPQRISRMLKRESSPAGCSYKRSSDFPKAKHCRSVSVQFGWMIDLAGTHCLLARSCNWLGHARSSLGCASNENWVSCREAFYGRGKKSSTARISARACCSSRADWCSDEDDCAALALSGSARQPAPARPDRPRFAQAFSRAFSTSCLMLRPHCWAPTSTFAQD